jgi:geminin
LEPLKKSTEKLPSKNKKGSNNDRKKLQTLQPSGKNKTLLVGADGLLRMTGSGKKDAPVKIYEDQPAACSTPERKPVISSKSVQAKAEVSEEATQVEEADTAQAKAEEFMYAEEFPPEYWKELAEKRREALEASLLENEELHTSLTLVEEEKSVLEQERDSLKTMAEQAEELAKIVKSLVTEDEEQDHEEGDGASSEDDN